VLIFLTLCPKIVCGLSLTKSSTLKEIAVVICCYNSELRIAETIKFLALQEMPSDVEWEVIVVNNASQDNTSTIAAASWERNYRGEHAHFKIVDEPKAGLTNARLTGVKSAEAEIIIFCDDDNHFSSTYVSIALQVMRNQPSTGIVGGIAKPKFSIAGREWLQDFFIAMAVGPQSATDGYVNWVYGAGMVIRKDVFRSFKMKRIKLLLSDRAGNLLMSGGDTEICYHAVFLGFRIYYTSALVLFHDIAAHRLEKKHYMKATMNTVSASAHLSILDSLIRDNSLTFQKIYSQLLFDSLWSLAYFFPRTFIGKHRFYSLFSFYRTGQTVLWLLLNRKEFHKMHQSIKENLHIIDKKRDA